MRSRQLRRLVASWFVLALMPFLIIVPVTIRNYIMAREFVPISTYFGENFLIGNGPEADGVTPWTPYLQTLEATGNWDVWVYINVVRGVGRELGIPNIKHSEVSRYFYRQTLDYIKDHKLRTLKLMAKKFVLFWTPVEITCNKVVQYEKEYYPPLKYLPGFAMVMALFVLGIALYLLDWKGRRVLEGEGTASVSAGAMSLLFLLFVVVYFVSFLPFFVNGRARVPIIPFCILIGAYGIWRVIQFAAARDYRRTALWAVVFAVLCVLASIQYIRFEPDRSRWHYQRADSYLRLGEVDKAIAEARPLLGQPDTASYMNMRLGRWFAQEGRIEEAFAQFMAALDNHPSDPDVQFNGAAELITIGKVDEGVAHYNEALRLDPNDARAHNNLGFLLEKQRRFNDALNHYREAVRLDPLLAVARNNLGNLLRGFGTKEAMDEAIDNFVKAIEADPKQEDYHYNLAALLAETGRTDKAIERYRIALELNPDDARAHNNLGLLLANREQYDAALQHYHEALRAVPDFVLVYANIGNMLVAQGKFDEGVAMYERGLAINPDDAGLHNGLGYLYAAHGKTDLALREYNEALRIEPDYPLAHNNLGNLLRTLGKTDEAMAHYNRALAIDPRDKRAHFNLAETFAEQGRFDEAIAQYELALASDPANADIPNNLANALVRKVRFDEAIRYYMLALQINPNHAGAHCNLGSVLALRGRREEAIEHFNKALQIDPNNTTAREGLRKLQG